ncbi:MAG: UbiA-like polyprenyltransferase [Pirellulaceae bacterium]
MWRNLCSILEMIRFSHTMFALPFAMMGAVMAWNTPGDYEGQGFQWRQLIGILLCMTLARSAAMAFNRIADRRIDAENPRTENRHLPSGALGLSSVVSFTVLTSISFVAATLIFLPNWLPVALSVPVLGVLFAYSFTKRFTSLAHFWLGLSLFLAPVSAWIAIRGAGLIDHPADILPAVVLGTAVLLWVAGFDIIYACQDEAFDRQAKLHSIPVRLGVERALRLAAACHFGMGIALLCLPFLCPHVGLGAIYLTGVAAVCLLLVYEHRLVRPDDLTRVNIAFFNVNSVISMGLFLAATVDLLWR